jgi:hypothetical protein
LVFRAHGLRVAVDRVAYATVRWRASRARELDWIEMSFLRDGGMA